MLTQKSALVAIAIGGMYNPYYTNIVERLAKGIQESGSSVLLFTVDHGEYIDEVVPLVLSYRVDGLISALSIVSPEAAESCAKARIPFVLFNGKLRNDWVSSVCCDNVGGGREIAELFIKRGCTKFAYIGGRKGNLANDDRLAGYMGRLAEEGITDVRIGYGDFLYEGACAMARQLFSSRDRPDAVFCANDLMAIGALEVARSEFAHRARRHDPGADPRPHAHAARGDRHRDHPHHARPRRDRRSRRRRRGHVRRPHRRARAGGGAVRAAAASRTRSACWARSRSCISSRTGSPPSRVRCRIRSTPVPGLPLPSALPVRRSSAAARASRRSSRRRRPRAALLARAAGASPWTRAA